MKNKGFTLIELLGVLVILSVLLIIAYPLITTYVNNTKEQAYNTQMEIMLSGIRDYASEHDQMLPYNDGEYVVITLGQLKALNIVKNSVKNPLDSKEFEDSMEFKISKRGTEYVYEIIGNTVTTRESKGKSPSIELYGSPLEYYELNTAYNEKGYRAYDYMGNELNVTVDSNINTTVKGIYKVTYEVTDNSNISSYAYRTIIVGSKSNQVYAYQNGQSIYFDPTTGLKCLESEAVSITGTKAGCMKWYAFLDTKDSDVVKLILDHNTTNYVAWDSGNGADATTIMNQLSLDTVGWKKTINNNSTAITARLITAEEINQLSPNVNWLKTDLNDAYYLHTGTKTIYAGASGSNTYAWLFDNTNKCSTYGCNIEESGTKGYWTSTYGASNSAWAISFNGYLTNLAVTDNMEYGIRPVIELDRSIFQ